jgi:hypothetical protein
MTQLEENMSLPGLTDSEYKIFGLLLLESIKSSFPMGVMKLSEFPFAFFASVFMTKYHRMHA